MEICLDGNSMDRGIVVTTFRPTFKRFNSSLRRGGSQRLPRRPASLLASPENASQGEENGFQKISDSDGPATWATSFEKLLEDPLGLHLFAEFLKKEFSAENIYFWTACERYRRLCAYTERKVEAQRIYQQHLCVGAPEPVNVDAQGRQCTEQCLQDPSSTLFDLPQKQIFNLMKFDSYPRFLKSDIYKQCLSGNLSKPEFDAGLMIQVSNTHTKLKKSLSNAEDRRRKSLLPWHRKNRSKSKDRGENEYIHRKKDMVESSENINNSCDTHSSRSSLTSLDLAITTQDQSKSKIDENNRTALCRVNLSNASTTVVQIKESETIQQLVLRLLEKRGITYSAFEVFTNKHPKNVDVNELSSNLAGCEVTIEQRVVFKLDLPNRKFISVKSKYTKIVVDVLRPILHKYKYHLEQVVVTRDGKHIDLHLPVTSIDGARLNIQLCDDIKGPVKSNPTIKVNNVKINKLDEITNQVFEGILQDKADSVLKPAKSDKGSIKSEDCGSEHSSGIFFGKFLRRDSGLQDKKKKPFLPKSKPNSTSSSIEDVPSEHNLMKKPLIAKLRAGANKLQLNSSESDELVEGLTRAQRCRLEDQRGTEINFELPDFLKDKENERNFNKPLRRSNEMENARFYTNSVQTKMIERPVLMVAGTKNLKLENYENRNVLLASNELSTQINKLYQFKSSPSPGGSQSSTPSKCSSLENTVIENRLLESPKNTEPPPLPPKPKIVPIKPPNWGQSGFYKKELSSNDQSQTLYLEQPSSSFV